MAETKQFDSTVHNVQSGGYTISYDPTAPGFHAIVIVDGNGLSMQRARLEVNIVAFSGLLDALEDMHRYLLENEATRRFVER